MKEYLVKQGDSTLLKVYIKPSAQKSEIIGIYGDPVRLKIALKSPPVDGKANKELIKFIAMKFDVRQSFVTLIRGKTSKSKDLLLDLPLHLVSQMLENTRQ